jgi:YaiO family outer membrane protein
MNKLKHIGIILGLLTLISNISAQKINTDSLFRIAINQAKSSQYIKAISTAKQVKEILPERDDISIFIANVYAWKGDYDSAKVFINHAYEQNPKSQELYDSWLNILLWNSEYEKLLTTADLAVKNDYKNHYNLTLKKLYAYKYLGEYGKGVDMFANGQNSQLLDSSKIHNVYRDMLLKHHKNTITAYYSIDLFDHNNPSPQHLAFIDYAFKIKKNTLVPRINYANRYAINGLQLEVDYYHLLKKGKYLYFNYGASVLNNLFPKHRAGAEFYFPLPAHFEASVGLRYMYFTDNHVFTLTGHIAKYIQSFWLSFRPYYSIAKAGNTFSTVINARKYAKNPLNFWGLELGYGNSPDDRYLVDPTGARYRLTSYRAKLEKNLMVGEKDDLRLSLGYTYEETLENTYRNRYTIEIIFKHRL